ncbi:hypothetical protein LSAT2_020202 [Lamellibrachia satsuma]|nr:hypothetical protein LSAT2_020202 [Lamellibrachia satsuma]
MNGKEDKAKKHKAKSRVCPAPTGQEDDLFELEEKKLRNNKSTAKKFQMGGMDKNKLNVISNIKAGTAKWRKYITSKRKTVVSVKKITDQTKRFRDGDSAFDRRKTGGIGLTFDVDDVDVCDASMTSTQKHIVVAHNRNLIEYFARLSLSGDDNESINLEYVETVLKNGADIDCTDKYGQSIFHEAARTWHLDVAKFLLEHGANLDQPDNYGRTPLHIAAAVDYPEMVKFLIANGAKKEARTKEEWQTPVHFAARNDACSSLKALIKCDCNYKEVRDYKGRTPLHVAAELGMCLYLSRLTHTNTARFYLYCNYKEVRDYKGRTPLHVAAELDRSETARLLLELDDPALAGVEDNSGQSAIAWMITKMPTVAKLALSQFHSTDRANRKQYYYLNRLDPRKPELLSAWLSAQHACLSVACCHLSDDHREVHPQTALQVIAMYKQFDLVTHAAVYRLIRIKWKHFGMYRAVFNTLLNLVFILLWSAFGIVLNFNERYDYKLPEQWWRIVLLGGAVILTGWQIIDEMREFYQSRRHHNNWKEWREAEIKRDIKFCHPRWPEEEKYLQQEINNLDDVTPQYFNDFWNIFDWICYALLLVSLLTHVIDVGAHSSFRARLHVRIMAITIILLWLRLMKNLRSFAKLGPFIVMLGHMADDVFKFFFLYLQFYIPFACAFWMIFGGTRIPEAVLSFQNASDFSMSVAGLGSPGSLMFSLFRLTLVDDYDFDGMKQVDSVMCYILVGFWLALSAILMLNLFIALLSDTFQRVYDNAKANAMMQKAIAILSIEERLSGKQRLKFRTYLHSKCAPEEDFYDDDATTVGEEDLKKVTFQIKDQLDELEEMLRGDGVEDDNDSESSMQQTQTGRKLVSMSHFEKTVASLQTEVKEVHDQQVNMADRFQHDLSSIKSLLKEMIFQQQQQQQQPLHTGSRQGVVFDRPTTGHQGLTRHDSLIRRAPRMDAEVDDECNWCTCDETCDSSDKIDESCDKNDDNSDKTFDSSDKTHERSDKTYESSDKTTDYSDKTQDSSDKAHDSSDKTNDSSDKANYSSDKTFDSSDKTHDSSDKTTDCSDKTDDSTDKTHESSDKTTDCSDKTHDSSDKTHDSSDKTDDSSDKADYSSDKTHDSSDKTTDSSDKTNDSGDKTDDSSDKADDSSNKTDDTSYKISDSSDKIGDSSDKTYNSDDETDDCNSDKLSDCDDKTNDNSCCCVDRRRSEKKRKGDLEKLRHQLAEKGQGSRVNSLSSVGFRPSAPDVPTIEVSDVSSSDEV